MSTQVDLFTDFEPTSVSHAIANTIVSIIHNRTIKFRAWADGKMIYQTNALQNTARFFSVIREDAILMQFTGLKDKKGKDIYEGDILKTRDEGYKLIVDNFNDFIYTVLYSEDHSGLNGYTQEEIEIIGNVFQNHELY